MVMVSYTPHPQPLRAVSPSVAALLIGALMLPLIPRLAPPPPAPVVVKSKPKPPAPVVQPSPAPAGPYVIKSALPVAGPLKHGQWIWNESAAPKTGPMLILVNIAAQTLSVLRDGHEIGTAVILYGADHKPTPIGQFPILVKLKDHASSIYADAPMPFTLRLTKGGVAIHGTEELRPDLATNGCIGIPTAFAEKLFGVMAVGDKVIIVRNASYAVGDSIAVH